MTIAIPTGYELLAVWGLTLWSEICPSSLVYLLRLPFGCTTYWPSQVLLSCSLALALGCVGSVAPWEGLPCRPSSANFSAQGYLVGGTIIHGLAVSESKLERTLCKLWLVTLSTGLGAA